MQVKRLTLKPTSLAITIIAYVAHVALSVTLNMTRVSTLKGMSTGINTGISGFSYLSWSTQI